MRKHTDTEIENHVVGCPKCYSASLDLEAWASGAIFVSASAVREAWLDMMDSLHDW